jgi:leucyl aminopeptidase
MVDIKTQKEFNLDEEVKPIVLANNMDNDIVKKINEILGGALERVITKPFITLYTLGKLQAEKVYVVNYKKLSCKCKRKEIYNAIADIEEDALVLVDTFEDENYLKTMQDLSEIIFTKNYEFNAFKTKKEEKVKDFYFYGETEIYDVVKKGYVYGESINMARDLVNTPYNYLNATDLANFAKDLERHEGVSVQIIDKKEIEEMNMGAFLGVNNGSRDEPKLIYVKYQGLEKWENPTALVGKGVMYDTGGYSLKTPASMPGMKVDMAGSAAVICAINAIATLKAKANVMAIVAATDNRIGDGATVPDDILTAASGKTIEIISTDAEGRLTLADAVWFAQKEGAKRVIDTATLTGAMVAALGHAYTGVFTNNPKFLEEFKAVTELTNEPIWEMPISDVYRKELKSKVADITNKGGRLAGASIAAAFIEEFIEKDTEWIHLDIAGTASKKEVGATGVMVKSFTELFL